MNKIKSIIIMGILLVSILIVLSPVSAATYNVYPGDDIEAIIEGASAGDTIYVHAGTHYPKGTISMQADHITIIGDDPFTTILDGSGLGDVITTNEHNYMIVKNLTIINAGDDGIEVQNYCEVTNCIIKNCDDGIVWDTKGSYNTIRYCTVLDCDDNGIELYDYNNIENCIVIGNKNHGIDLEDHNNVKNCLVADNGDEGFNIDDYNKIINCTISNNGVIEEGDGIDGGDDCEITNCIVTGNSDDGIDIHEGGLIQYCNSWDNVEQNYDEQGPGEGCISQDPKFVSGSYSWPGWYQSGVIDYFLSPGSPCIDRGSTTASALGLEKGWSTTLTGRCDTNIVDMGFHFASNCATTPSLPMDKILKILKGNQEE